MARDQSRNGQAEATRGKGMKKSITCVCELTQSPPAESSDPSVVVVTKCVLTVPTDQGGAGWLDGHMVAVEAGQLEQPGHEEQPHRAARPLTSFTVNMLLQIMSKSLHGVVALCT